MKWTILVFVLLIFGFSSKTKFKESDNSSNPNIILILTHDQQWNTINALGNKNIYTPNMDRMADGALVFNNANCFGGNSGVVSIPSRNMLISGRTFETNNLAENPEYSEKITELIQKLDEERKAAGDKMDLYSGNYSPAKFVARKEKLPAVYPAGGLAPLDSSINK